MDLKIPKSLLERVQIHKNAAKSKYLSDLKDFSVVNSSIHSRTVVSEPGL